MYRTVFWTLWERERVEWFGRMALKHLYYHIWNESPVQVRCTILDAWGWCTGTTQRDGTGRKEEGSGWETLVYLWQIHVDIGQNQYNIVKLKNKIKIKKNFKVHFLFCGIILLENHSSLIHVLSSSLKVWSVLLT